MRFSMKHEVRQYINKLKFRKFLNLLSVNKFTRVQGSLICLFCEQDTGGSLNHFAS